MKVFLKNVTNRSFAVKIFGVARPGPRVKPTVACRGCWMPGANEVLGYPRKYFVAYSSRKISDDLF